MQETLISLWLVLVVAFCLVGTGCIIRDIVKSCNVDDEIKRAIAEGEIDNFDEVPEA